MSILMKMIILLLLFVGLNIISIYSFNYKEYFNDSRKDVQINEDRGFFNFFGKDFFQKAGYLPSTFSIEKQNGIIVLNGVFSSEASVDTLIDSLNINQKGSIKIEENRQIDSKVIQELLGLIEPFKDFLEDGSKIIVENGTLLLEGRLKNDNYKEIFSVLLNKITTIAVSSNLEDAHVVEIINLEDEENKKNSDKSEEINNNLTINDIQLLINDTIVNSKIIFERRSVEPTADSRVVILKIVEILKKYDNYKVEVAGHTDSRGNPVLNKKISQDRANSVKSILIELGVKESRIVANGYGNEQPIAKDDENGLSEINRRVEFNLGE